MNYRTLILVTLLAAMPRAACLGQARISLGKKPVISSVSPTERPTDAPDTQNDTLRYSRLVRGAYHALENDSFATAKERFNKALRALPSEPGNAEIYYELGQLEEREGRHQSAIRQYTASLDIQPRYIKSIVRRGGMYLLLGQLDNAVRDFDNALDLAPDNADALFFRGCAWAQGGNYSAASRDFQTLLSRDSTDERAAYSLALAQSHNNEAPAALLGINALIRRVPNNAAYLATRADIEERLARYDDARADWAAATSLAPKDYELGRRRVLFLARRGERKEALETLDRMQESGIAYDKIEPLRREIKRSKNAKPIQ